MCRAVPSSSRPWVPGEPLTVSFYFHAIYSIELDYCRGKGGVYIENRRGVNIDEPSYVKGRGEKEATEIPRKMKTGQERKTQVGCKEKLRK